MRVSSPPGRDHLLRVGRHRPPNQNSKPLRSSAAAPVSAHRRACASRPRE
jgi:hypothetical protein